MDNKTFKRSSIIHNESLNRLVTGLLEELTQKGYAEYTIKKYYARIRPIQNYMELVDATEYTPELGNAYLKYYCDNHKSSKAALRLVNTSVLRLNDYYQGVNFKLMHSSASSAKIPDIFCKEADGFLSLCKNQGNSIRTLSRKKLALAVFLTKCEKHSLKSISSLTAEDVMSYTFDVTDKWRWYIIRDFLQYLAKNNLVKHDLSTFVPHLTRKINLPSTYNIEEISSLEAAVDRTTSLGKRDYDIILLASRLGIRAGDIAKMNLTNDESLRKMLYLASKNIVKRWTQRCRNWDVVLNYLKVMFEDRMA